MTTDNIAWIQSALCKSQQFEGAGGGGQPLIDWTDKMGALAHLTSAPQKHMIDLLVYGDHRDTTHQKHMLIALMVSMMLSACREDGQSKPKRYELSDLASRIAAMALFAHLRPHFNEDYTLVGRMRFVGINPEALSEIAYKKTWQRYERQMTDFLNQLIEQIDVKILDYRKRLENELFCA